MHTHFIEDFRHAHVFLGEAHARNERKTWIVIAVCTAMMVAEIIRGVWFGSMALVADGLHMSTHAGALLIAALAYTYSRRYASDERFIPEPKGTVAKQYGTYQEADGFCERALFVIDRKGLIFWNYLSPVAVNPGADGILHALEQLSN